MKTIIYFEPVAHKYTNNVGNAYISATTIIGEYEYKFSDEQNKIARACSKIGRNPNHPKYLKYKGMSPSQILAKWKRAAEKGCEIGNTKHDYLETSIKDSTEFKAIFGSKYEQNNNSNIVKLYTIEDVIDNPDSGKLNLDYFINKGVKDKYPKIYKVIESFVNDGWRVYSELGVFHNGYLISGLIDVIFIKDKSFVILDWKTNKDPIRFEGGYWEKNNNDVRTNYKLTDKTFKPPLHKLPYSVGNKYILQLSLYAYLVEQFGFNHVSNILCHITHDNYKLGDEDIKTHPDWIGKNRVEIIPMPYLKHDIQSMVYDYSDKRTGKQMNFAV